MKKIVSAVLASIILISSLVICVSANENGCYPQYAVGDYTIVATTRIGHAAPHTGNVWLYYDYGVIDNDGSFIVEPIYSRINEPKDGRALYSKLLPDKSFEYGYLDENWQELPNVRYDTASDFSEGVAVVGLDIGAPSPIATTLRYGCINTDGELIVPIEYHSIAAARDGIIKAELYEQIYPFTAHRSRVAYYSTDGTLLEDAIFRHEDKNYEAVMYVNPIRFGDTPVDNTTLKYPIVSVYDGSGAYLPLTEENCRMLGIGISGNVLEGISLRRERTDACVAGVGNSVMPSDGKAQMRLYGGAIIVDGISYTNKDAPVPMLYYKDVVYLPLYWVSLTSKLGLGYSYDLGTGIKISTENLTESAPSATIPVFDVTFNGTRVENQYRQYPLIVSKDITYFPMTYFDCRFLGLTTEWDNDTRTLYINKENISCAYRDYKQEAANESTFAPTVCDFNIVVNGKAINNSAEEYPLLTFRDVTYFPLTWRFAVDEFGWEYSFDAENGLAIGSDNDIARIVELPYLAGTIAFDDNYYYYNGTQGEKNYVYRAPISDPSRAEVIYNLPDSGLSRRVGFLYSDDGVYFQHVVGSTPIMSTIRFMKINPDGTVIGAYPDRYRTSSHGNTEIGVRTVVGTVEKTEISVKAVNRYPDARTEVTYTKNGVTSEMPELPGHVTIGRCFIDGKELYRVNVAELVKILGEKIYFSAYNIAENSGNNDLYVIDTSRNEAVKLIDGIEGAFHVYYGWSNELSGQTAMIIFGKDGKIMRYTEKDGAIKEVGVFDDSEGLVLEGVVGDQTIYTLQKTLDGAKTVVGVLDDYGSGNGSVKDVLFETTTGTNFNIYGDKLTVMTSGESPSDSIRMAVFPRSRGSMGFRTSDVVTNMFVYKDTIVYILTDGRVVRVDKR